MIRDALMAKAKIDDQTCSHEVACMSKGKDARVSPLKKTLNILVLDLTLAMKKLYTMKAFIFYVILSLLNSNPTQA